MVISKSQNLSTRIKPMPKLNPLKGKLLIINILEMLQMNEFRRPITLRLKTKKTLITTLKQNTVEVVLLAMNFKAELNIQ